MLEIANRGVCIKSYINFIESEYTALWVSNANRRPGTTRRQERRLAVYFAHWPMTTSVRTHERMKIPRFVMLRPLVLSLFLGATLSFASFANTQRLSLSARLLYVQVYLYIFQTFYLNASDVKVLCALTRFTELGTTSQNSFFLPFHYKSQIITMNWKSLIDLHAERPRRQPRDLVTTRNIRPQHFQVYVSV